ncbi:Lipid-binding serum glycoprotein, C-terminal domain and Bactericidal permeability-increasing protein, alpha/beta domain-containing protein [Strongyloides ratti]|uniref:Lipid-binding serum glycoprotein, C-terminal domain and Bactericidal permeability-increasing protein, alpha/beta domain-containing protein n=1 Tax=Strongyloides ratti TaxID=34506 RepID=A0A090MW11_STRRB|nr:Lipid-binding serum glycoprotein, C-terminal domain and Bactericidal permeability-increasing protein, alpha/beta domain-containing protein [Strongyloides ratti]CEF63298.1 Lipid-binding serum glycoprotein, C-terminal domain and Bactericidal permeability-increasing protein, alpha/beta domain-containing protein [Strongyloides ratti]
MSPIHENNGTFNMNYKNANIRVRINDQLFQRSHQILQNLFIWQVQNAVIENQLQCFPEGCVTIYDFRITGVTLPKKFSLNPLPPNLLQLEMEMFDMDIQAKVNGNLQMLLGLPLTGNLIVTARSLFMPITLELQKTIHKIPIAHVTSCGLASGIVSATLQDAGVLTDIINIRYANELNIKAREVVESTLCDNMNRMISSQINSKLRKFPRYLNVYEVMKYLEQVKNRYSRHIRHQNFFYNKYSLQRYPRQVEININKNEPVIKSVKYVTPNIKRNLSDIFDFKKLKNINIYLDIIDTSSSISDYIIGINGFADLIDKSNAKTYLNTFHQNNMLPNFPKHIRPKMVDVIIDGSILNSLLHQLWRNNAFNVKIDKKFPEFENILKTSCSLDEVCISDSIPEVGENYPDKYLIIKTFLTSPPIGKVNHESIIMNIEGMSIFALEEDEKEIGKIPFTAKIIIYVNFIENSSKIKLSLLVPEIEIHNSVDFFGLKPEYLTSLKTGAVNVIQKFVNSKLSNGIDFQPFTTHLADMFGVYYPTISLLDSGELLFQSDLDVHKLYYSPHFYQ